jgi:hypothetical protein
MNIGLDFDGVINNLGRLKAAAAKKLFEKDLFPEDYIDKDFVLEKGLLTGEEYKTLQNFAYTEKEAVSFMHEVPGAFLYIRKLLDDGHTIKIVTIRPEEYGLQNAKEWLAKNNFSHLEIVGVGFQAKKRDHVNNIDVFVDDTLLHLYHIHDIVPHRFLFHWGYNGKYDEKEYARRVYSWEDLYSKILALS